MLWNRKSPTVLEGILSTVTGVKKISSSTNNASGRITVEFDKNTDLRAKRFEVASLLRESRKRLPERGTLSGLSMNMPSNQAGSSILTFQINGNANTSYIYTLAEELIKPQYQLLRVFTKLISMVPLLSEWEIIYDQEKLSAIGVSSSSISSSINNYLLEREIGGATETYGGGTAKRTYLTLTGN